MAKMQQTLIECFQLKRTTAKESEKSTIKCTSKPQKDGNFIRRMNIPCTVMNNKTRMTKKQ